MFGFFFFFQAEDGIRDYKVTGVQTCALPISAVAGTHEELGLREPAHGATQMCAVDGEDLEALRVDTAHPARDLGRVTVPLHAERVLVLGEAGLSHGEAVHSAQLDP